MKEIVLVMESTVHIWHMLATYNLGAILSSLAVHETVSSQAAPDEILGQQR